MNIKCLKIDCLLNFVRSACRTSLFLFFLTSHNTITQVECDCYGTVPPFPLLSCRVGVCLLSMPLWKVEPTCGLWTAAGREPSIMLHKLEPCKLSTLASTIVTLLKVGMAEIFHLFFSLCTNQSVFSSYFDPRLLFSLDDSQYVIA